MQNCLYKIIHYNIVYNNKTSEGAYISNNRWQTKLQESYVTEKYTANKNNIGLYLSMWKDDQGISSNGYHRF